MKRMKKVIIFITMFIAFILLIGESETITIGVIATKILSLTYLWIVAKVNNYFYQWEE